MNNEEKSLTLWEHVAELRSKLLFCVVTFIIGASIAHVFHQELIAYLTHFIEGESLIFLGPLDAFLFIVKIDVIGGLILSLPFIVWALLSYLYPAIPKALQKNIRVLILSSFLLIILSISYGLLFTIPVSLRFLLSLSVPGVTQSITAESYLSFIMNQLLILIIIFQIPLLIIGAHKLGLVKKGALQKKRRLIYFILIVAAAIITPTGDAVNLAVVVLPCILLFEVSLIIIKFMK